MAPRTRWRMSSRTFIGVTHAYLVGLFENHTDVQAQKLLEIYIGKWMRISGQLGNVMSSSPYFVQVTFERKPLYERSGAAIV
jgi:hypothetical protein